MADRPFELGSLDRFPLTSSSSFGKCTFVLMVANQTNRFVRHAAFPRFLFLEPTEVSG
jgi:hypothetical protein